MPIELIAAALAAAPQSAPVDSTSFSLMVGLNENPALMREAAPAGSMRNWINASDLPPGSIPEKKTRWIKLRVEIGADGTITDCIFEERSPITDVACARLRERGRFTPALDQRGRAVAGTLYLSLDMESRLRPPAPPAPPAPPMPSGIHYHLMTASRGLRVEAQPDWKAFVSHDRHRDAEVATSLYRYNYNGETRLSCYAVASSGDRALDKSTCDALQTARYTDAAYYSRSATILIRWKGDAARIVMPSRDNGSDVEYDRRAAQASVAMLPTGAKQGFARLTFPADGKDVRCKIVRTTGIDSADFAACRQLEKIRFKPAIDIYGRQRQGVQTLAIGF